MRVLLCAVLLAAPLSRLEAQRQATSQNWVTLGLGQASWGGLTELGGQLTFSHQRGRLVLTGRGLVGFDILGGVLQVPGMIIDVEDFGLLVGAGNRPGLIRYSVGAGVGRATITRKGSSSTDVKSTAVGVPLEGQLFVQPLRFVGVGFYGYGDLNKEKSFWGWSISVALGRVR